MGTNHFPTPSDPLDRSCICKRQDQKRFRKPQARTKFDNDKTCKVEKDFASIHGQPAPALAFHPVRFPPLFEGTIRFHHLKKISWTLNNKTVGFKGKPT